MSDTFQAHEVQKNYCDRVRGLGEQLRKFPFLAEYAEELHRVVQDAVQPFNVAVFGRMKTGKSSLINAIIGRPLAITGVEETTATINRLSYASGEQLGTFKVHWKDAQPETFPVEKLQNEWNGTSEDVLARVKRTSFLELYADVERLKDIHIIDTPGTGSTATEHEDTAQQFIAGQETDALVYVFAPVGRETDEDALATFRKGCLESSDPYNSIAVLHKWDHVYWENGGDIEDIRAKANRLREHMKNVVADVVPISAPLALLVKVAPADFWESCLSTISELGTEEELQDVLMFEALWNRDAGRKELYRRAKSEYGLPWSSFQITLRELMRNQPCDARQACAVIRALSGYDDFESTLDKRIFKHRAVIRLRQTRARAQKILGEAYFDIKHVLDQRKEKLKYLNRIGEEVHSEDLKKWLEHEIGMKSLQIRDLDSSWRGIDAERHRIKDEIEREDKKIEVIRWLNSDGATALANVREDILRVLEQGSRLDDPSLLDRSLDCIAPLLFSPDARVRRRAEMLKDLLINLL